MLKRRAVATHKNRFAGAVVTKLALLDGLVLAGFLVRFLEQRADRERLVGEQRITTEETHLADEPVDAFDAISQGEIERGAKFRIFPFFDEQLLMSGERHHGISDFMSEPISHGLHEAEIGSLDFEAAKLFDL